MKKKYIILLLLLCTFTLFTGCTNNKKATKKEEKKEVVDPTLVKINDLEFHLKKETSYKNLKYTIVEDFQETIMSRYIQYKYNQEDGTNLLFFRIFVYDGKSIDEVRTDLGIDASITTTDGKNKNLEFKKLVTPRDDGGTMNFYFITKDNTVYAVSFISKYDIKDFEEKVVNSLYF